MNPEPHLPQYSPFDHLKPELWNQSKAAHITLFTIGTILMIPAAYALVAIAIFMTMWDSFGTSLEAEQLLGFVTGMASTCTGGLAWCALGLLFFKRADARWQRFCWAACAVFGFIATPCAMGWWIFVGSEVPSPSDDPDILWLHGIFLFLVLTAFACATFGVRYSRQAGHAIRSIPKAPQIDMR
jgi:hypothetical protein